MMAKIIFEGYLFPIEFKTTLYIPDLKIFTNVEIIKLIFISTFNLVEKALCHVEILVFMWTNSSNFCVSAG